MSVHEFLSFLNKIKDKNPELKEEKLYSCLADKIEQETPVVIFTQIHHRESLAIKKAQEDLQKSLAKSSPALPAPDSVKTRYEVLKDELFPLYIQHRSLFEELSSTRNMKLLMQAKALERRIKKLELELSNLGLKH